MNRVKTLTAIGSTEIIGLAVSSLFWLILANLVNPENYGNIFYLISIAGVASLVSPILSSYVSTTYAAKKTEALTGLYTISFFGTVIGILVVYLMTNRIDVCFLIFGYVSSNLTMGKMLGEKKIRVYTSTNLFQKCLTPVFGFLFYFLFGFDSIFYALALTYILHIVIFVKEIKIQRFNLASIKPGIRFICFNYLNNLAGLFGGQVDKLLIATLFGHTLLGNYSLITQVIGIMMIIPNIFFRYVLLEDLYQIENRRLKIKIVLFAIGISILGFFILPQTISHIFPKYLGISEAIGIMSLSVLPSTYSRIQTSRYLSQEKGLIILGGTVVYACSLFLGIVTLVNFMGITGLAISFVVASFSQVIAHTILIAKLS